MGGLAGYTPKQVEEVKLVLRLLPVFAATVLYWWVVGRWRGRWQGTWWCGRLTDYKSVTCDGVGGKGVGTVARVGAGARGCGLSPRVLRVEVNLSCDSKIRGAPVSRYCKLLNQGSMRQLRP